MDLLAKLKKLRTNWKYIAIVVVLAFVVGGIILYNWQTIEEEIEIKETRTMERPKEKKPEEEAKVFKEESTCQILVKGNLDLPPLYKEGIIWQQPRAVDKYLVELYDYENYKVVKKETPGCLVQSEEIPLEKASEVRYSYYEELLKRGWTISTGADAPYGFYDSYQKDNRYFVIEGFAVSLRCPSPEEPELPLPPWRVKIFLSF